MRSNGNHVQLLHIYTVVIFDEWIFIRYACNGEYFKDTSVACYYQSKATNACCNADQVLPGETVLTSRSTPFVSNTSRTINCSASNKLTESKHVFGQR